MTDENTATAVDTPVADAPVVEAPKVETPVPAKTDDSLAKMQKRIDRLTWELRERDRQARPESKTEASETPKPPTRAEHEYDEDKYQAALLDFLSAKAEVTARDALKKEREQEAEATRKTSFQKRQDDFIKSHPEYREKVLENESLPITQEMAQVISESEMGPEVAFYLAENEDKAAAIAQLSPFLQARELGRIEAKLEAAKAPPPPPPKVSEAPPPVPKIEATDPKVEKDPKDMTDTEFAKWRRRQIAQRR